MIERAWRCQQRLYQRWQRMAGRGKPHQKIVVACARELAGFGTPHVIRETRPLDQVNQAIADVEAGRIPARIVLQP